MKNRSFSNVKNLLKKHCKIYPSFDLNPITDGAENKIYFKEHARSQAQLFRLTINQV